MKTVYFFTASLLLTLFVSFNSYAGLIVESIDTALERNIFAPNPTGAAPATKKTPASVKKTPSVNPSQNSSSESVSYNATGVVTAISNSKVTYDADAKAFSIPKTLKDSFTFQDGATPKTATYDVESASWQFN